jgi:hypothetical protein
MKVNPRILDRLIIIRWAEDRLLLDDPNIHEEKHSGYEADILLNNIHGVDLDSQAAEIAAVNLILKALKAEEMLPPILGETIKLGNSLISGSEEELKKYFGEEWRIKKPFEWTFNSRMFFIVPMKVMVDLI